jgi:glycogen synthase
LVAGSGDAWSVLDLLRARRPDDVTSHAAYSEQFVRACASVGADALVLTTHRARDLLSFDGVECRRMNDPLEGKRGLRFHAASFEFAAELRRVARDWQPNVWVLCDDPPRAAATALLGAATLIRVHHCALWTNPRGPSPAQRALLRADRPFLRHRFAAFLSASSMVSEQITRASAGEPAPIIEFLPSYHAGFYDEAPAADAHAPVMRVLYLGRVEPEKGAFDVLETAMALRHRADIAFDVCGVGSALEELRARVARAGLADRFVLHGWCDRPKLTQVLGQAHLGIVPSRILEGFNQALVEMLLARRPVIATDGIPAVHYAPDAVRVVPIGDTRQMASSIEALVNDRSAYETLRDGARACTPKFLDDRTSYRTGLTDVLSAVKDGAPIRERRIGFDGVVRG